MRTSSIITLLLLILSLGVILDLIPMQDFLPVWLLWPVFVITGLVFLNDMLGKPVPFLRWSFLRLIFGMKTLLEKWQVGDGREQKVAEYVIKKAEKGNPADVVKVIDHFGYNHSLLINVGDKKGTILDAAIERVKAQVILELGTYVGYSAIRMAQKLPEQGQLYSIEFSEDNAAIARKIIDHAGLTHKITVVVGTLDDGGKTVKTLESDHGFSSGSVDFVFIDHAKDAYMPDLKLIMERGWLHEDSVVVADNIKFPGAPDYQKYMNEQEGKLWESQAHKSYVEYQSMIPDIVLESRYLVRG